MSQICLMTVVVQGLSELIAAVAAAGLSHETRKAFRASNGESHDVDLVVTDEEGTQVGVKVAKKTGVATFIGHDEKDRRVTALVNRVAQRYAYSKAVEELKRKGYQIAKEEKQKDGSIRLVAQRWR